MAPPHLVEIYGYRVGRFQGLALFLRFADNRQDILAETEPVGSGVIFRQEAERPAGGGIDMDLGAGHLVLL